MCLVLLPLRFANNVKAGNAMEAERGEESVEDGNESHGSGKGRLRIPHPRSRLCASSMLTQRFCSTGYFTC